jgi:DNA-binding LacI/PurR family transcriptional regulator
VTAENYKADRSQALAEIVRRTKVSKATVLRVLNGQLKGNYPRVAERHKKIRRLADELNYRPSYAGRTIANGRTMTIGLLYPPGDPKLANRYAETIHRLAKGLGQAGYDLALHAASEDDCNRTDLLLDRRFDGYAIHDYLSPAMRRAIGRAGLPCVLINAGACEGMSSVEADDVAGARTLTGHLLRLGHRRILYVSILPPREHGARHVSVGDRETGYRDAMGQAGLGPLIWFGAQGLAERIRDASSRPTAVIVYGTDDAVRLLPSLNAAGLRVPADVSLAGFCDTEIATLSDPPLTVMNVPFGEFGRHGAEIIVEMVRRGPGVEPRRVVLPLELVERQSVCSPGGE